MSKANKVKFNIRNVHYALLTIAEDGSYSFGTPVPMPGAVSLSMDPNGEPSVFYADGYAYYTISNNQGYEGDLELAMVPDSFRTDVLKENLDKNKVLVEEASVATEQFALLFEFDGISTRSAMCSITARLHVRPLNRQPPKMRSKSRRKPCPSRPAPCRTVLLRQGPLPPRLRQHTTTGTRACMYL